MRRRVLVVLVVVVLAAGCAGSGEDEELQPGTVARIGIVAGEPIIEEGVGVAVAEINNAGGIGGAAEIELARGSVSALTARGVRLLVLPCRKGVLRAARDANASGALAVAPCDDGVLPVSLDRVYTAGLSPAGQAAALESYVGDDAARLLLPATARGRRVASLLDLRSDGAGPVSPDAPERVTPPEHAPEGTVYATYGFPDPGNEVDEFYERYRSLHGRRPDSILAALGADAIDVLSLAIEEAASTQPARVAAELRKGISVGGVLGTIEFPGGTNRPHVDAAIVRVEGSSLRLVARR
jgi:ABC-type branched-subunit amino acid transport system substrate-binding protein